MMKRREDKRGKKMRWRREEKRREKECRVYVR